jgi:hypothetical protein
MAKEPHMSRFDITTHPPAGERTAGGAHLGEDRPGRARAEAILLRYPELEPGELAELLRWYRREASAMDVALIASDERLRRRLERFQADHLKAFNWKEKLVTAALGSGIVAMLLVGLLPEAS